MTCRSNISIADIEDELKTLTLVCDTREHDTPALRRRLEATGLPVVREKLDFGDYSCRTKNFDFTDSLAIERKMSVDEIAQNFTRGRKRFANEFERGKAASAKVYILVERASWETVMAGKYRTLVHPNALMASFFTWQARYNSPVLFCQPETTPIIMREIMYRESRQKLEQIALETG